MFPFCNIFKLRYTNRLSSRTQAWLKSHSTNRSNQKLNMSSDQQKMYTHAYNVGRLLSSDLPEEDIVIQIGGIVVGNLSLSLWTLSDNFIQRDVVETIKKATDDCTPMHVPAILLSASAEFDQAYRQGGNQKPQLSNISEDDQRTKTSSWYQPLIFAQNLGIHSGMHRCHLHYWSSWSFVSAHSSTDSYCETAIDPETDPNLSPNCLWPMPN